MLKRNRRYADFHPRGSYISSALRQVVRLPTRFACPSASVYPRDEAKTEAKGEAEDGLNSKKLKLQTIANVKTNVVVIGKHWEER